MFIKIGKKIIYCEKYLNKSRLFSIYNLVAKHVTKLKHINVCDKQVFSKKTSNSDDGVIVSEKINKNTRTLTISSRKEILPVEKVFKFHQFGLFIYVSKSIFLSFRCGQVGQRGNGGHSHFDQLSIELWINGKMVIGDPGSVCYTPNPAQRNIYRSSKVHFTPLFSQHGEPGKIGSNLFSLERSYRGNVSHCSKKRIEGYHLGYKFKTTRTVKVLKKGIQIIDSYENVSKNLTWSMPQKLHISNGYGVLSNKLNYNFKL